MAINYALRTTLSKSKNVDLGSSSSTFGNSTANIDINKLKKRIQTLCERLEKGGSLMASSLSYDRADSPDGRNWELRINVLYFSCCVLGSSYKSTKKEKVRFANENEEEEEIPSADYESMFFFFSLPLIEYLYSIIC